MFVKVLLSFNWVLIGFHGFTKVFNRRGPGDSGSIARGVGGVLQIAGGGGWVVHIARLIGF